MAYEMRPGSGSLFKNDKKTTDNHPNLKGKIMLPNGEVRWVSAWTKVTSSGEKWISLSVGDLVVQAGRSNQPSSYNEPRSAPITPAAPDLDDDIPF
jgi:uncharacterized protein (DUF736 family)